MPFLICRRCNISYEIYSKGEPLEIATCTCGNQFEYVESLEENLNNKKDNVEKTTTKDDEVIDQLIVAYESIIAKIVLYSVYEIPFSVTQGNLNKVIRGSKSSFIRKNKLASLRTYGIFSNFSREKLKKFILILKDKGLLEHKSQEYGNPHLVLTESGRKFISSGESIVTSYLVKRQKNQIKETNTPEIEGNSNSDDLAYELKNNPKSSKRSHAAYLMGESRDPIYVSNLCEATKDISGNVRRLSASALGKIRDTNSINALINLLGDENDQVRQYAVKALGMIGDNKALPFLEKMNEDSVYYVRESAEVAITKINKLN